MTILQSYRNCCSHAPLDCNGSLDRVLVDVDEAREPSFGNFEEHGSDCRHPAGKSLLADDDRAQAERTVEEAERIVEEAERIVEVQMDTPVHQLEVVGVET